MLIVKQVIGPWTSEKLRSLKEKASRPIDHWVNEFGKMMKPRAKNVYDTSFQLVVHNDDNLASIIRRPHDFRTTLRTWLPLIC